MSAVMRPLVIALLLLIGKPAAQASNPAVRHTLIDTFIQNSDPVPAQDCSLAEYRVHLVQLQSVVAECASHVGTKSCDWLRIGPDDNVSTSEGKRLVRYAWLRRVLLSAANPVSDRDQAGNKPQGIALSLEQAHRRLQEEQTLRDYPQPGSVSTRNEAQLRRTLAAILAGSEFQRVQQPNFFQRLWSFILQWLVDRLTRLAGYSRQSRWITRLFVAASVFALCILLVWCWVAEIRRQRLALWRSSSSHLDRLPPGGEWRRLLDEAQRMSQAGRWSEAIHSTYWAAIALLEFQGLWQPDHARTSREYLAVLRL